jgi:hypothetical protein
VSQGSEASPVPPERGIPVPTGVLMMALVLSLESSDSPGFPVELQLSTAWALTGTCNNALVKATPQITPKSFAFICQNHFAKHRINSIRNFTDAKKLLLKYFQLAIADVKKLLK